MYLIRYYLNIQVYIIDYKWMVYILQAQLQIVLPFCILIRVSFYFRLLYYKHFIIKVYIQISFQSKSLILQLTHILMNKIQFILKTIQ